MYFCVEINVKTSNKTKKIIAITVALLAFAAVASAQPKALGLRFGYNYGAGAALSYQHWIGGDFLDADLGWCQSGFSGSAVYDFTIFRSGGFGFYGGPGAHLGFFNGDNGGFVSAGIVGELGVEYNFSIPLQISLDFRPIISVVPSFSPIWTSASLGLRYQF